MKQTRATQISALLLIVSIVISIVSCTGNASLEKDILVSNLGTVSIKESTNNQLVEQAPTTDYSIEMTEDTLYEETVVSTEPEKDENGLTEQQRNSFSMLYHLAITAEDIRISKDNRLILDDIYTS